MNGLAELMERQDGVISRRQARACGLENHEIARRVRRREWTPVHPGVYVHHTGPLTWRQRAWAAVLACGPSALGGISALRAHEGPGRRGVDGLPIEVVVPHRRRVVAPTGVVVTRLRRFDVAVQRNLSPPRMRYDDALLAVADAASTDLAAIAVIADACGGRRTTAARLLASLEATARLHRRAWLRDVLADVALGTCSVLEHGYLTRVERPHGLPRGLRQVADTGGNGRRVFRDVRYGGEQPRWRQIVELDGRLFHSALADRDRDLDRDLDAALTLQDTVRLGYGQVFERGCATAWRLARLFQGRGWRGQPHPCPACPPAVIGGMGKSG
ncbi:type IV toxin-antitoxin system AbiEi family antitoxin domain-containing protein [Nocardioides daeguensis]|uniref:AbiEi antitoxin N-terminal domain-containing protein n=1 Tax=Nocardioides daeguensis TaxID=908359 RepID=A0ABP6V6Z5_9ACTN|nr:type IV toxin-antitoxin system AbiEi family antitoxin domain-containing protein [Nocardioides daeguensis]MBV6726366.1 type IV toxin-antitoxin system AbiEi family antitoxin domain-containing protein [Nocardioides daeguensis]MCR1772209.1 type IV toxin-antitoxin system AbiEi family antitoxin domain-containing protein [Nocardioides daeguensis]